MADQLQLTLDDVVFTGNHKGNPVVLKDAIGEDKYNQLSALARDFYDDTVKARITALSQDMRDEFESKPSFGSFSSELGDLVAEESANAVTDTPAASAMWEVSYSLSRLNSLLQNFTSYPDQAAMKADLKEVMVKERGLPEDQADVAAQKLIDTAVKINAYGAELAKETAPTPNPAPAPDDQQPGPDDTAPAPTPDDAGDTNDQDTPDDDTNPAPTPDDAQPQPIASGSLISTPDDANPTPDPDATPQPVLPQGIFTRIAEFNKSYLSQVHPDLANDDYACARMAMLIVQNKANAAKLVEFMNQGGDMDAALQRLLETYYLTGAVTDHLSNQQPHPFAMSVVDSLGQPLTLVEGQQPGAPSLPMQLMTELDNRNLHAEDYKIRYQYDDNTYTQTDGKAYYMHTTANTTKDDMVKHGVLMLSQLKAAGNKTISFNGQCTPAFIDSIIAAYQHVDGIILDPNSLDQAGMAPDQIEAAKQKIAQAEIIRKARRDAQQNQPPAPQPQPQPVNPQPVTPQPQPVTQQPAPQSTAEAELKRKLAEEQLKNKALEDALEEDKPSNSTWGQTWKNVHSVAKTAVMVGLAVVGGHAIHKWVDKEDKRDRQYDTTIPLESRIKTYNDTTGNATFDADQSGGSSNTNSGYNGSGYYDGGSYDGTSGGGGYRDGSPTQNVTDDMGNAQKIQRLQQDVFNLQNENAGTNVQPETKKPVAKDSTAATQKQDVKPSSPTPAQTPQNQPSNNGHFVPVEQAARQNGEEILYVKKQRNDYYDRKVDETINYANRRAAINADENLTKRQKKEELKKVDKLYRENMATTNQLDRLAQDHMKQVQPGF